MSSNISSSDLKAKALIDVLKKSQTVTDNYIVKYIATQPPKTDLHILEVVNKFATSDSYKTSILEKAYLTPIAPIEKQPELNKSAYSAYQVEETGESNCRGYCCLCLGFLFATPITGNSNLKVYKHPIVISGQGSTYTS